MGDADLIDAVLPPGAVHQGIALLAEPLPEWDITDLAAIAASRPRTVVIALDKAQADPQNVGAVLRSAAASGAAALVVPDRHAPEATGALADRLGRSRNRTGDTAYKPRPRARA